MNPFLVGKIETFCKPAFLSHPHRSMLGWLGDEEHNFMFQNCHGGVGDDFTVRCYLFIYLLFIYYYFFAIILSNIVVQAGRLQ